MTSEQRTAHPEILYRGRQALEKIQRFPGIEYGHENLAAAFDAFADTEGVIFISGLPRAGKTHTAEQYNGHRQNTLIGNPAQSFSGVFWEEAENEARKDRLVNTPNEEPFTAKELTNCNNVARKLIHIALDSFSQITFEAPALPYDYSKGNPKEQGRDIGGSTIDSLVHRRTWWFKQSKKYDVRGIALIGGPVIQLTMLHYRQDIKKTKSLDEGRQVAEAYGKPLPDTEEAWKNMRDEGASPQQIAVIENALEILLNRLEREEKIIPVTEREVESFYEQYIRADTETLGLQVKKVKQVLRQEIRTARLALYKFNKWEIPSEHAGIFFNNPTVAELGLTNIDDLKARIKKSPLAA